MLPLHIKSFAISISYLSWRENLTKPIPLIDIRFRNIKITQGIHWYLLLITLIHMHTYFCGDKPQFRHCKSLEERAVDGISKLNCHWRKCQNIWKCTYNFANWNWVPWNFVSFRSIEFHFLDMGCTIIRQKYLRHLIVRYLKKNV